MLLVTSSDVRDKDTKRQLICHTVPIVTMVVISRFLLWLHELSDLLKMIARHLKKPLT